MNPVRNRTRTNATVKRTAFTPNTVLQVSAYNFSSLVVELYIDCRISDEMHRLAPQAIVLVAVGKALSCAMKLRGAEIIMIKFRKFAFIFSKNV